MWRNLQKWWRWHRSLGARAERAAARHLRRSGYRILARNLRSRLGEIDILAEDPQRRWLIIVEVKAAENGEIAPEQHVNFHKQRKLSTLAAHVVRRYGLADRLVRFDVIGVVWPRSARQPTRLTHHPNAFEYQW